VGYLKRVVTYCSRHDSNVNQEISFREVNGTKELSLTCTRIKDSCKDCFNVKLYGEHMETETP
jgi:hypothetical protein